MTDDIELPAVPRRRGSKGDAMTGALTSVEEGMRRAAEEGNPWAKAILLAVEVDRLQRELNEANRAIGVLVPLLTSEQAAAWQAAVNRDAVA